jgi:hypothetical protein
MEGASSGETCFVEPYHAFLHGVRYFSLPDEQESILRTPNATKFLDQRYFFPNPDLSFLQSKSVMGAISSMRPLQDSWPNHSQFEMILFQVAGRPRSRPRNAWFWRADGFRGRLWMITADSGDRNQTIGHRWQLAPMVENRLPWSTTEMDGEEECIRTWSERPCNDSLSRTWRMELRCHGYQRISLAAKSKRGSESKWNFLPLSQGPSPMIPLVFPLRWIFWNIFMHQLGPPRQFMQTYQLSFCPIIRSCVRSWKHGSLLNSMTKQHP